MIVRCKSCDSAFAVDDAKVLNKKFAFTCPKCATENIIDNKGPVTAAPVSSQTAAGAGMAASAVLARAAEKPVSDNLDFGLPESPAVSPDGGGDEFVFFDDDKAMRAPLTGEDMDLSGMEDLKPEDSIDVDIDNLDLNLEGPAIDLDYEIDITADEKKSLQGEIDDFVSFDQSEESKITKDASDLGADIEDTLLAAEDVSPDMDLAIPDIDGLDVKEPLPVEDELDLGDIPVFDRKMEKDIEDLSAMGDMEEINLEGDNAEAGGTSIIDEFEQIGDAGISGASADDIKAVRDDLESLDIPDINLDEEIKGEDVYSKEISEDEDVTIDLDTLDIDLDEEAATSGLAGESLPAMDESSETLDLDSLDIDLDESGPALAGDNVMGVDEMPFPEAAAGVMEEENETLDLSSLDIPLEESTEIKSGEDFDDDDKLVLTLEDTGLSMDELATHSTEVEDRTAEDEDEDLRLTIDEVDPSLGMIDESLEGDFREAESVLAGAGAPVIAEASKQAVKDAGSSESDFIFDELEDLPDIDLGEELPASSAITAGAALSRNRAVDKEALDIKADMMTGDESDYYVKKERDVDYKGSVSFSIDYSLSYSKIGSLLRMFFIYIFGMIPHFVVLMLYSVLSAILGFINNIIVIATGESVEDFTEIQENTIRYFLSMGSSMSGVVEDMPVYAGRKNIDYPLQMSITYPIRNSRTLALLRISFIGISLISLPHIIIASILSLTIPFASLIGQISVLFTSRWPRALFDYIASYNRYIARVFSYIFGLIDEYPPFRF